ncbi:amidohydrolase [Kitasatospora sp. NPDC093558]|uniref:amidohydrolase n=1 Tax=Kitasatospora sp. NPDC093558 TaxID=3155201 RepID=UPI003415AB50
MESGATGTTSVMDPTGVGDLGDVLPGARSLYEALHAAPEPSGQEEATARLFAARLRETGCEVTTGIGGHGVVALLSNGPGPVVALRAELDALPVTETTGLPYASRTPGVMHACGHDAHLACAAGTAAWLAAHRDRWAGTLMVIGQPAEETLSGARALLDDGLYDRFPRPDAVLAQHVAPLPCGVVAHGPGALTSATALVNVVIPGRGGHGATPHLTVDPVVTAAAVVQRLQTVVSRENNPFEPLVLTVGTLHAGTAANVVPDRAELGISIRCYGDGQLDRAVAAVRRIVRAECEAAGCPEEPVVRVGPTAPVTFNDPAAAARVRAAHTRLFGERRVLSTPPMLASEDFGRFAADGVPTVYWFLGSVAVDDWRAAPGRTPQEKTAALPANHAPDFAPAPEATLRNGVLAATSAVLAWLGASRPEDLPAPQGA